MPGKSKKAKAKRRSCTASSEKDSAATSVNGRHSADPLLLPSTRVVMRGVQGLLDGAVAHIQAFDPSTGRYSVTLLNDGTELSVEPKCVALPTGPIVPCVHSRELFIGIARAQVEGLIETPEANGSLGCVLDFEADGRCCFVISPSRPRFLGLPRLLDLL
jgi:hypothetical protein